LSHEVEKSFSALIFSGVLDRFPQLQIVSVENNIGWLPYHLQRMDRVSERPRISAGFTNKLKPSEYFQRQMWATYIDDFVGAQSRYFIGVDKLTWPAQPRLSAANDRRSRANQQDRPHGASRYRQMPSQLGATAVADPPASRWTGGAT
jgi:hypothetical protein